MAESWDTCSQAVLRRIPSADRACQLELNEDESLTIKTPGIIWLAEDVFTFKFKSIEQQFKPTKRNVLKKTATLFDPLGFLSPFIIAAKMIMQKMWIAGTDWDDLLSDNLVNEVNLWFSELDQLQELRIPRCLQQNNDVTKINVHTFVDASQGVYGAAVVYVRMEYKDQTVSVRFVAAKTKVAPLQSVGIPRMELMGACLGVKLTQSVIKVLLVPMQHVVLWCDSTSVLLWIRGHGKIFKPFVANRIGEIQSSTNPDQWRYVPTESNPANYLTRGKVSELVERKSWWEGPTYLQDVEER